MLASACTSTRYYTSSEYDDVYYSSTDQSSLDSPVANNNISEPGDGTSYDGAPTYTSPERRGNRSYNDFYYADDDFFFSRRIRRFNNFNTGFRYFDPFFTNDLYFVIGTNSWNRWNNRGWYSWNNPRFGVSWGYNPGWDPFFYRGFYNPYVYNPWNRVNYYNPWVNAYYGYAPTYGFAGFGGWGNPGWATFGGWGGGFAGYAYCPPSYYRAGTFNNTNSGGLNVGNYTRIRQAHRNSPGMLASRPGTTTRTSGVRDQIKTREGIPTRTSTSTTTTTRRRRTTGDIDYLRPATRTATTVRRNPGGTRPGVNTGTARPRNNPRVNTSPDRNRPNVRPSTGTTRTRQENRATRPTPSRDPNVRQNNRQNNNRTPSVSPSRRNSPSVSPSRSSGSSRRVTPSRSTTPSRSVTPSRRSTRSTGLSTRRSGGRRN